MFSVAFLVTFLCSSILAPARNTNAETVTESSSASGYTLSLSATPVVNLNVGVLEVPVMTVGVGTVSTSTTAPNGYKLYLSMAGTSNDLRRTGSDVDTISATTGTMADSSALGIGEWGYAIPSTTPNISATDFDTSYDIMESAYPSSKGFAAPPISTATAQLITSTPSANETENDEPVPDEVSIYYGVNADNTTELGTYTNSVLWTAVADAAQTAGATVSPTSASAAGGDTITVTSTLFSTSAIDANIYMLTSAAWQDVSSNPSHISNYSSMQMSGCTQSSSTPVTYTGCVTPANDEGTGYHVYMDVPRYEKRYNADFTYESAGPTFWNISTMQEMTNTICSSVTAPTDSSITTIADTKAKYDAATSGSVVPQRTLIDPRGAEPYKSYTVRKLADGNCWMVQNLALENATLDSSNSNLPSGKTVTLPASSTSGWTNNLSQSDWEKLLTINYADAGLTDSKYGNFYNWYTASATYGKYKGTQDVSYSICPKGWRLPTGGDNGEFQTLYGHYNSLSALRDSISGPGLLTTYNWWVSEAMNNGASYYSSTASNDSNGSPYGLSISYGRIYPTATVTGLEGASIRCIADTTDPASEEFFQITTMQEMTNDVCSSVVAPTSSSVTTVGDAYHYVAGSTVPTTVLKDTRDNNYYTVKKLADGRCWMTDNLRLVGPISASDLNSTNTNVASDSTFALTASNTGTWCTDDTDACDNQSMVINTGSTYGVLYNWYAATAGTGKYDTTTDTSYSICPKGWRLPKGGSSGEFQTLYGKYNTSALMRNANGPNFILAGYRNGGSSSNRGIEGRYWSSTAVAYDNNRTYSLKLDSLNVYPADDSSKYLGLAVRCINAN